MCASNDSLKVPFSQVNDINSVSEDIPHVLVTYVEDKLVYWGNKSKIVSDLSQAKIYPSSHLAGRTVDRIKQANFIAVSLASLPTFERFLPPCFAPLINPIDEPLHDEVVLPDFVLNSNPDEQLNDWFCMVTPKSETITPDIVSWLLGAWRFGISVSSVSGYSVLYLGRQVVCMGSCRSFKWLQLPPEEISGYLSSFLFTPQPVQLAQGQATAPQVSSYVIPSHDEQPNNDEVPTRIDAVPDISLTRAIALQSKLSGFQAKATDTWLKNELGSQLDKVAGFIDELDTIGLHLDGVEMWLADSGYHELDKLVLQGSLFHCAHCQREITFEQYSLHGLLCFDCEVIRSEYQKLEGQFKSRRCFCCSNRGLVDVDFKGDWYCPDCFEVVNPPITSIYDTAIYKEAIAFQAAQQGLFHCAHCQKQMTFSQHSLHGGFCFECEAYLALANVSGLSFEVIFHEAISVGHARYGQRLLLPSGETAVVTARGSNTVVELVDSGKHVTLRSGYVLPLPDDEFLPLLETGHGMAKVLELATSEAMLDGWAFSRFPQIKLTDWGLPVDLNLENRAEGWDIVKGEVYTSGDVSTHDWVLLTACPARKNGFQYWAGAGKLTSDIKQAKVYSSHDVASRARERIKKYRFVLNDYGTEEAYCKALQAAKAYQGVRS